MEREKNVQYNRTKDKEQERNRTELMHASVIFTVALRPEAQATPLPSTACRSIKHRAALIHHPGKVTIASYSPSLPFSRRRVLRAGSNPIVLQTLVNPGRTSAGRLASQVQMYSTQGTAFTSKTIKHTYPNASIQNFNKAQAMHVVFAFNGCKV